MPPTAIDSYTRWKLEEAIREARIVSGLDGSREPFVDDARPISIGITSPDYGDGKTTIAMSLAGLLSRDFGKQVSLVDADFHTHSLDSAFGLFGEQGLSEVISGLRGLIEVTHPLKDTTMQVVPAGQVPMDAARLVRSERLHTVISEMKAQSSYVVLDLPAALHSMNTAALAQRCDAVLVVARHGHTRRADIERVLHLLRDVNVIGVIVNRHKTSVPRFVRRALGIGL